MKTLWRKLLYDEFLKIKLDGSVLDLGGSKMSGYHRLFQGDHNVQVLNLDPSVSPDFIFDLEKKLPFEDKFFDNILLINVLEHVYKFKELLAEIKRILKPGGVLVLAVPFLIQIHSSPSDYWRFSEECLERSLSDIGFSCVDIKIIGTGPFSVVSQIVFNLLHFSFLRAIIGKLALFLDIVLKSVFRDKDCLKKCYPLGYLVVAKN